MSERKVLNKYYSPDFDPSKIPRLKKKSKQTDVRTMAPFNMKCSKCNEYIATGTKFNAKKEVFDDAKYNNLSIYRFYIRCPRCSNRIIYRTDPKERHYEVEQGATENFRALKLAEREAEEAKEAEVEEEKINPMKHLENRTKASKLQMEATEQIQNIRSIKAKFNSVNLDQLIAEKRREREAATTSIESVPRPIPKSLGMLATTSDTKKMLPPKKKPFLKISSSLSGIKVKKK